LYDKIRDVLEITLDGIDDLPVIFWEAVPNSQTTVTEYISPKFIPTSTRPSTRGRNRIQRYQGLYRLHVYCTEDSGPQRLETLCNTILDTFKATADFEHDGTYVSIEYSERTQVFTDSPFCYAILNIAWYTYGV